MDHTLLDVAVRQIMTYEDVATFLPNPSSPARIREKQAGLLRSHRDPLESLDLVN
jgi:hypothetical protein